MNRRVRIVAGFLALAFVAAAAWLTSPTLFLDRLAWLAADPVRFGLALLALAAVRPLLAWPTTLLAVAAGYGYGLAGFPVALALVVATSVPPFLLARRARGDGRVSTTGERAVDAVGEIRAVTASRLFPAPSDVVSAAAGVAGVATVPFAIGTALGEIPWVAAGVLAGSSAPTLAREGLAAVFDARLVAAAALLGLLVLSRPAYRWIRDR